MDTKPITKLIAHKHENKAKTADLKTSQNKSSSSNIHNHSKKNLEEKGKGKENENVNRLNKTQKTNEIKEIMEKPYLNTIDLNEKPNNKKEPKEHSKGKQLQQTELSDNELKENLNFEKNESTNKNSDIGSALNNQHHEEKEIPQKENFNKKEKKKEKLAKHTEKEKEHFKPNKHFSSKNNLKSSASGLQNTSENKTAKTPVGTTNIVIKVEKAKDFSPNGNQNLEPNKTNKDINKNINNNLEAHKKENNQNQHSYINKKKESSESLKKVGNFRYENLQTDESESSESVPEIKNLLEKNRKFVNETLVKNPEFLQEMGAPHHQDCLIISCSDSRILTSKILGTHPGELFVHTNMANLVLSADFNLQTVLSYAVEHLKVRNIIVLGHTDCSAIKTSLSNDYNGLLDNWLKPVKDIVEKNYDLLDNVMKKEPGIITNKLSELNVKEQVINLCKNPIIQKAWQDGRELFIHGLMFHIESGFIQDLKTMKKQWKPNKDIHA